MDEETGLWNSHQAHAITGWWLSQFYSCLLLLESPSLLIIGGSKRTWVASEDVSISCFHGPDIAYKTVPIIGS